MNYKDIWWMMREAFSAWSQHEAPRMGAALAFYTILSLAPLVILVISIVALVIGESSAQDQLVGQVRNMVGKQGAEAVKGLIDQAREPAAGSFAVVIGVLTLLIGASGVFGELRSGLNKIWNVAPRQESGVWAELRLRFFSFGMVLAVGFLLLVSLLVGTALAAVGKFFGGMLPLPEFVLGGIDLMVSLGGTVILFALMFRYVPETKIAWRRLWVGATATAVLFTLGKFLIGLYLGKAGVGSAYGAAGSFVVLIVWVYYSAMIFLFGAEFTHVLGLHGEEQKVKLQKSLDKYL